ncbi:tyrosine-type recombinase/integrase [Sphingobium lactosutens]|nr:site-specific integrase [Sphingobium lactosutens]
MPTLKFTKTAIESARPEKSDYELRDTVVPGFLCKVTPSGRKVFMLSYRTVGGNRRKPAIGQFGELTVEQARSLAQDWQALVRAGGDPSLDKTRARANPTIREFCEQFIEQHSIPHNKPGTVRRNRQNIKNHIIPVLGKIKVADLTRPDVSALMMQLAHTPGAANTTLACLKKMFNCAELWGYRADGTNPCRLIPRYPERKRTRLIKNRELESLFAYLDRADAEGLEHPSFTFGIRLQFAFAARMSEIISMQWEWIDFHERRVVWPDSKTGGISKPLTEEAITLLARVPRREGSRFVCPAIHTHDRHLSHHSYWCAWKRIIEAAGLAHVGTHGIRHRAATDIANSGVPLRVGMALTAHKTVTTFMRYVHIEDDQVRLAAEKVSKRRAAIIKGNNTAKTPTIDEDAVIAGGMLDASAQTEVGFHG